MYIGLTTRTGYVSLVISAGSISRIVHDTERTRNGLEQRIDSSLTSILEIVHGNVPHNSPAQLLHYDVFTFDVDHDFVVVAGPGSAGSPERMRGGHRPI